MLQSSKAVLLFGILLSACAAKNIAPETVRKPARTPEESSALFAAWARIRTPAPGAPAAIGNYTAGCLRGAEALPRDGLGYQVMRLERNRFYGHPRLVNFLEDLAERLASLSSERMPLLSVGDMAQPRGGPMFSGHASHQIGLDVDIWYRMWNKRLSRSERESLSARSYVDKNALAGWTAKHTKLVAAAASFDEVERIFVHAAIKKHFCREFPDAPWLYKLRAWWGHDDHLHVRLRCPSSGSQCQQQEPLNPRVAQCGEELDWWFTEEAAEEFQKRMKDQREREFPPVPAECIEMAE